MRLNDAVSRLRAGDVAVVRGWIAGSVVLLSGLFGGCSVEPSTESGIVSFTPHCGDDEGDLTCSQLSIGKPFCDLCRPASNDQGCSSEPPSIPACRVGGGATSTFTSAGSDDTSSTTTDDGTTLPDSVGSESTAVADSGSSGSSSSSSGGPMLPCETPDGTFDRGCEDRDGSRPYCVDQTCVSCEGAGGSIFCGESDALAPACSARTGLCSPCGDVDAFACDVDAPICDGTGACRPCATHDECGSGACHLDPADPQAGECFAEDEVVFVDANAICPGDGSEGSPSCSLAASMAAVAEGESRVFRLGGGDYVESAVLGVDAAVALIGGGGVPTLAGDGTGGAGLELQAGRAYLDGVRLSNNPAGEGLLCEGASVWMQRSEVGENADYGVFTSGPCALRIETTTVFNNGGGGIRALGGSMQLDNAAVGNNGNGNRGPGINAQFTTLDVLYSTIAGNDGAGVDSLQCLEVTGSVRNSIVVGVSDNSASLDCFSLDWASTAVDSGSFAGNGGQNVTEAYNPLWFNDEDGGDFRLGAPPLTPFGDVALWLEGDPETDADGTTRPMGGALGYAGVDEPG